VWSTDTPSNTRVSGAGVGFLPTCDPTAPTAVLEGAAMPCPRDESEHPTGIEFCGECIIPLTGVEPILPLPATAPLYPRHVAEKRLTSTRARGDERTQVTVLCADRKGSME
jgi:hypothetical protein